MIGIGILFLAFLTALVIAGFFVAFRLPWLRAAARYCAESGTSRLVALPVSVPWLGPRLFYWMMARGTREEARGNAGHTEPRGEGNGDARRPALVLDLRTTHNLDRPVLSDDNGRQLAAVKVARDGTVALAETAEHFGVYGLKPGDIVLWAPLDQPRRGTVPLSTAGPAPAIAGEITDKLNSRRRAAPGGRRRFIAVAHKTFRGYASGGGVGDRL